MKTNCIISLLLVALLLLTANIPALALSSAEKEQMYSDALVALEGYLEDFGDPDIAALNGVVEQFEKLGGYMQSAGLKCYALVLLMIENGEYDPRMTMYLNMIDNEPFVEYITDELSPSSIHVPSELRVYAEARKAESDGDIEAAVMLYRQAGTFFDTLPRLEALQGEFWEIKYQEGLQAVQTDDLINAYFCFDSIRGYRDSDMICNSLEQMIGYVPEDSEFISDKLTGLSVETDPSGTVILSWNAHPYAKAYRVEYRIEGDSDWVVYSGRETGTYLQVIGLQIEKKYWLRVIGFNDTSEWKSEEITFVTSADVSSSAGYLENINLENDNETNTFTVYITASSANVRVAPDPAAAKLGVAQHDNSFLAYDEVNGQGDSNGTWFRISYNGQMGYVSTTYAGRNRVAATPKRTATPVPKPTASPTPKRTATPVPKPTASPTPKRTATPVPKPTASPTAKRTATPVPKPTASPTPKQTASPTPVPTVTQVPADYVTHAPNMSPTTTPKPTLRPRSTPAHNPDDDVVTEE